MQDHGGRWNQEGSLEVGNEGFSRKGVEGRSLCLVLSSLGYCSRF